MAFPQLTPQKDPRMLPEAWVQPCKLGTPASAHHCLSRDPGAHLGSPSHCGLLHKFSEENLTGLTPMQSPPLHPSSAETCETWLSRVQSGRYGTLSAVVEPVSLLVVQARVLTAPLPIQLPANARANAVEEGKRAYAPAPTWETGKKLLAPSSAWAQLCT